LLIKRALVAFAALDVDTQLAARGDAQLIAETLVQLDVLGQQNVLYFCIARALAQQQFQPTDAA
jgi:predicted short-subunit dehydrogenase-like oxidoreductase (DUF2520 family)